MFCNIYSDKTFELATYPSPIKSLSDYRSAVEHYISFTNHLELFYVSIAAYNLDGLMDQLIEKCFKLDVSYKVIGLLIVDGIRLLKSNRNDGLIFLKGINDDYADDLEGTK